MLPISFQLYSARFFPPLEAQLDWLAQCGYDAVEPWLPAYGDDAALFRRSLLLMPRHHVNSPHQSAVNGWLQTA